MGSKFVQLSLFPASLTAYIHKYFKSLFLWPPVFLLLNPFPSSLYPLFSISISLF